MKLVLGIIVSLFFSSVLFAQTATLRGTVTDDSGARLAKRHDALSLRALRAKGLRPEDLRDAWF